MSTSLHHLKRINKLKHVKRHCNATADRAENTAEHVWSVAMYVWILHAEFEKEFDQKLDVHHMIKMSLMHDLVEIETGDVSVWDTEKRAKQEQNDQDMSQKVFQSFAPDLSQEFILLWNELTANATLEAKIVNGLDRLSPTIQRLITGQGWKSIPVTIHDLDALLLPKIMFCKTLQNLYIKIKEEALNAGLIT